MTIRDPHTGKIRDDLEHAGALLRIKRMIRGIDPIDHDTAALHMHPDTWLKIQPTIRSSMIGEGLEPTSSYRLWGVQVVIDASIPVGRVAYRRERSITIDANLMS